MSKVSKIFGLNLLALITVVILLVNLLKTYAVAPTVSFTDTCVQVFEYYGINLENNTSRLLIMTVLSMLAIVVIKLAFSLYKIKQRAQYINANRVNLNNRSNKLVKELGLENRVILVDVQEHIALVFGLIKPKIIISTGLVHALTSNELETVLLHEKHHLRNFHSIYIFVAEITKSALFFLPILNDLTNYLRESIEHDADRFATKYQKSDIYLRSALKKVNSTDLSFLLAFSSIKRESLTNKPRIKIRYINATITLATAIAFMHLYINKPAVNIQYTGEMCVSNECVERCLSIQ